MQSRTSDVPVPRPLRQAFFRRQALTLLCCAAMLAACGGGGHKDTAPSTSAAARLVRSQSHDTAPSLAGMAQTQLLRYRMPAVRGGDTEANALLLVPKGTVPAGGWPLVVWAHGTVGVADDCAPSRRLESHPERSMLELLLKSGYAVLAPDYEGLDAPGVHPYLSLSSQGRSITAAVEAAHELKHIPLSQGWAVMGHSQGGFAALAAAEYAPALAERYPLKVTLALAPGTDVPAMLTELFERLDALEARGQGGDPDALPALIATSQGLAYNASMVAHGLQAQDPALSPSRLLHTRFVPVADLALRDSDCSAFETALERAMLEHWQAGGRLSEFQAVKRNAFEDSALREAALRNLPGSKRLQGPVFYLQGSEDEQTPVKAARATVARMQAMGTAVQYLEVEGANHSSAVETQLDTIMDVLKQHHR